MSVYNPLLACLFTLLVFLFLPPDGTRGAFPARCASSCRIVAGWVETGADRWNRLLTHPGVQWLPPRSENAFE